MTLNANGKTKMETMALQTYPSNTGKNKIPTQTKLHHTSTKQTDAKWAQHTAKLAKNRPEHMYEMLSHRV